MELRKVHPGDQLRIPARDYNSFVDAAIAHRRSEGNLLGGDNSLAPWPACVVLVRNDTDDEVDRFAVLGIDGVLFTAADNLGEFTNRPAVKCVVPTSTHTDRFVVTTEPIAQGKIGRAVIAGITPVKLDVQSETDKFASATVVTTSLKSSAFGTAQILYREPGTGVQWAIVRFPVGGSGGPSRWAQITAVEGDTPPFLYSAVEVAPSVNGSFQTKSGGVVLNRNLYNAGEYQYPGCGKVPVGMPVLFWDGPGCFLFSFPWYRGTYG